MTPEALATFWRTYRELRNRHQKIILISMGAMVVAMILLELVPKIDTVLWVATPILFSFYLVLLFQSGLQAWELPCPECGKSFGLWWRLVNWRPMMRCGGCGVVIPRSA
jgi:hypothetical protein